MSITKHHAVIEKLTWKQARGSVLKVNPKLGAIIDRLSPNDDFLLFRASYPFGTKIIDKGILQLPIANGKVAPINSFEVSKDIRDNLQRRSIPVSLVMKNRSEVYFEMPDRVICLNTFAPGFIFGLWEHLDPPQSYYVKCIWSVMSGARSLYLLPKITDVASHKELRKKYGIRAQIPKNLFDQWQMFTEVANSLAFEQEWRSEILFFADRWMAAAVRDPAWKDFHNFVLQDGWDQSQYWRNKITFDIVWELYNDELLRQNLRPNLQLVSIVKHIVLVGTGVLTAFAPAIDDSFGPISNLQQVLIHDYKLRDYVPTFMQPELFALNTENPRFVYYSLHQPSLLEKPLISYQLQSILKAMPEIHFLLSTFNAEVNSGRIKANDTPIETFAKSVVCDYFHNEANKSIPGVRSTEEMSKEDPALLAMPKGLANREFAATSRFIRGCIRFSKHA